METQDNKIIHLAQRSSAPATRRQPGTASRNADAVRPSTLEVRAPTEKSNTKKLKRESENGVTRSRALAVPLLLQATGTASGNRETTVTVPTDCDPESFEALPLSTRMQIRAQLRKCLQIIQQSRTAWQTESAAWMEIRDHRLYLADGYTDFEQFCLEHLQAGKSTVNRQIAVGEVYKLLAPTGATLPTSERQIRPLLILRQPKQDAAIWGKKVTEVWAKVVHDAEITKKPITEKSVLVARKQLGFDPQPKSNAPEADLEKRWKKLEALIEHEKEVSPVERRHDLRVRIASLISGWKDVDGRPSDLKGATATKTIDIAVEMIESDTPPPPVAQRVPEVEAEPEPED